MDEIVDNMDAPSIFSYPYCRAFSGPFVAMSAEAFVESDELGEGGRTSER